MKLKPSVVALVSLLILFAGVSEASPITAKNPRVQSSVVNAEPGQCNYGQCYAIAKSTGRRCLHCVSRPGDSYCWQHK
jgi:hypothetical protein